jgi:hypothetical protein
METPYSVTICTITSSVYCVAELVDGCIRYIFHTLDIRDLYLRLHVLTGSAVHTMFCLALFVAKLV